MTKADFIDRFNKIQAILNELRRKLEEDESKTPAPWGLGHD